jgi:hypothetical protein
MKNKEIILLIEELKQQVEECRDRDSSNYIDSLLKRTDWVLEQLKVNNVINPTTEIVRSAIKSTTKDVILPKCVRDGKVK